MHPCYPQRISIHLMFILIDSEKIILADDRHFNTSHVYINRRLLSCLCIRSRHFNTSHVYINQSTTPSTLVLKIDFNTSHVYINHTRAIQGCSFSFDFNTSHVYINLRPVILTSRRVEISIHLMFILIVSP